MCHETKTALKLNKYVKHKSSAYSRLQFFAVLFAFHRKCWATSTVKRKQNCKKWTWCSFSFIAEATTTSKLTVRLHIENSLVVCTWGQKWPQTQSIISSLIIHVHKNCFCSLLARCLFYKNCRLFGAKLFVIVLLLYIIYTHCQPETQAVLQYSEHRSCRRPAV